MVVLFVLIMITSYEAIISEESMDDDTQVVWSMKKIRTAPAAPRVRCRIFVRLQK